MATKITNKLISLPQDVSIDRVVDHPHSMEIFISSPDTDRLCPVCASRDCVIKDSGRSLTVRHIAVAGKGSFLSFHVPRLRCKQCGASFSKRPYFVHPSMKLSAAAFLAACVGLTGTRSIRDIAIDNGLTEQQVLSVLCSVDFRKPPSLPRTLCIDEFKGSSGSYDPDSHRWNISRFHCNISDGSFGCVVDVLPQISLDFLLSYFMDYSLEERRRVRFFCCDMHGGFISLAKRCFPDVKVCVDMFHVVKLLNDNVSDIRRSLQNSFRSRGDEESYQLLKRSARLLTTSSFNKETYWGTSFKFKERQLERVLTLSNHLREAYNALQDFHSILQEPSYSEQRDALTQWLSTYSASDCEGTRRCAGSIRRHRSYIQNSWKYGKSNGPCEGLNNRIKVLKRNCYGLHDFDHFRRRVLFSCGHTKLIRETYTNALELAGKERRDG